MKRLLIPCALLVFLFTLLVNTPAYLLARYSPVPIQHPSGTLWHGSGQVAVTARHPATVTWQLQPLRLLTGQLAWQLGSDLLPGTLNVAVHPWDLRQLHQLGIDTQHQAVAALAPLQAAVQATLSPFAWPQCRQSQGHIHLQDSQLLGISLGLIRAELGCRQEDYQLTFVNEDGAVSLNGVADLRSDGRYQIQTTLHSTQPDVQQALEQLFGRADSNGTIRITQAGRLF